MIRSRLAWVGVWIMSNERKLATREMELSLKLKWAVEEDIERYSDLVDWIFIKRLWTRCLTKLGCELLPEEVT